MIYYAGIGSRQTPKDFVDMFKRVGRYLANEGCVLRSGGAKGADIAFEIGCDSVYGKKEIYLPWKGFENSTSNLVIKDKRAYEMAKKYHPMWSTMSAGAKKLQARNVMQVLGQDLNTPSRFIICWTRDGDGMGGTGQAIRIANSYKIPVFDCGKFKDINECRIELKKFIDSNK